MRILLFIDGLGSGGAQRQFAYLASTLARAGHEVTVAVYNDQDHFAPTVRAAGAEIVRLAKPSRFSPRPIAALARLYRRERKQVTIAFLRSPAAKAELARFICPSMRVIAAERSAYPHGKLPAALAASQYLHRLARFVTVNSSAQAAAMRQAFPWLEGRIAIIRNGFELPEDLAHPPNLLGRSLRLVAVSSLMPYKNSVRLAEAIAILKAERGLKVEVDWLGETFAHLPRYGAYPQTAALLDDLGIADSWRWLGARHDVASVMRNQDALIHPSLFEGTSNAVCEAMALGLPVLAGDVADHQIMIDQAGAGLTFDPGSSRSIADAIAKFAALDARKRRQMGDRGRQLIEDCYSFEAMVSGYEALARAAIEGRPRPASLASPSVEGARACAG